MSRFIRNVAWFVFGLCLSTVLLACASFDEWADHDRVMDQIARVYQQ